MNDAETVSRNANPYLALGVRPFINCCSVRTLHGGSLMLPQVRAAIAEASRQYVNLDELMEAAGRRLAELTGAESALVTCGSAAAVALGTAACVAGNDPARMLRLPFTEGWVNRVVMVRNQRFAYDQAIRMIGTHIVEVETIAELDAALAEPVAMIAVLGTNEAQSVVRMEDLVARAKPRKIPILVDAASEHLERPSPWLVRGADLVIYSGGKFLRGPQTSGLLLGNKDLVQAAWRNASPHQALGRPMKVSKEDVVGLVAAVEYWFEERDAGAERTRWNSDLEVISGILTALPEVSCEVVQPSGVVRVPSLRVRWNAGRAGLDGEAMRLRLLDGAPRIMLDDTSTTTNGISVDPFGLQPGEAAEVGQAIAAVLTAKRGAAAPAPAPAIDVSGEWDVRIRFLHGDRSFRVRLQQQGGVLSGHQSSEAADGPGIDGAVAGALTGEGIHLRFDVPYEGSTIIYRFDGTVRDGRMDGVVMLGSSTKSHQGIFNAGQFGKGAWDAVPRG